MGLRPVMRRLAVAWFWALRLIGVRNIARGKHRTGKEALAGLQARLGETADLSASFAVDAPLPPLDLVYRSDEEVSPRPVDAFMLVVDASGPGYTFRNNLVLDPSGLVLTEDHLRWDSLSVSRSFLEPVTHVQGTVVYLSNTEATNIGHWLCLTLPLLHVYEDRMGLKPDYYYVGAPLRDFHVETLAMLGIRREQILTHGVSADRMVAAIENRGSGAVDADMLGFTRERIGMAQPHAAATRRLFVGRGNVLFRRMLNEQECFALLRDKYGFEYVTMDGLTVAEQVALFSSAECVVAPHGAALTHLLWASRGVKVLNMFSYEYRHPWFMEIGALVGARYAYVVGKPTGRSGRRARRREANLRRRADLLVDLEEVERAVRALGITPVPVPPVRRENGLATLVRRCRSCASPSLYPFSSLGMAPVGNSLVSEEQLADLEPMYPLGVALCEECSLVQLFYEPPSEAVYNSSYPCYSSFSDSVVDRGRSHAEQLITSRGLGADSLVVEVGSNDGYLLRAFADHGVGVLGIDPSPGPAAAARERGIPTLGEFFDADVAARLRADGRRPDVILVNNVMAAVADLDGFVKGLATLLAPDGIISIEDAYVGDIVDGAQFDSIYHEHLCYFSCTAVDRLVRRHGLSLNRVEHFPRVQGGTMRWTVGDRHASEASVREFLDREQAVGLHSPEYYSDFGMRVVALQKDLLDLLYGLRHSGARIAAYGAGPGGATLLNTTRVPHGLIDYVVDRNVHKQGRFLPGTHLPIRDPDVLTQDRPDYVLLLAWDQADEIVDQLDAYRRQGGRFITPVPKPQIVS